MAHAQDDANENHWPGYVDALTTMLMVLTFVMMILGIAVFAMSQNVSRIIVESIAKAALIEIPDENVPVPELTERIIEKLRMYPPRGPTGASEKASAQAARSRGANRALQPDGTQDQQEQARLGDETRLTSSQQAFVPPAPAPIKPEVAGQALVIEFQPRATRLDEATVTNLNQTLASEARFKAADMIEIRALVDRSAASVSDARRVAYYRAMLVRSAILQSGIPAARVRVLSNETWQATEIQGSRELVRVIPLSKSN